MRFANLQGLLELRAKSPPWAHFFCMSSLHAFCFHNMVCERWRGLLEHFHGANEVGEPCHWVTGQLCWRDSRRTLGTAFVLPIFVTLQSHENTVVPCMLVQTPYHDLPLCHNLMIQGAFYPSFVNRQSFSTDNPCYTMPFLPTR